MSNGTSMAVGAVAAGVGSGFKQFGQGQDDKLSYEALKEQREHRKKTYGTTEKTAEANLKIVEMKLKKLQDVAEEDYAWRSKKDLNSKVESIFSALSQNNGSFATKKANYDELIGEGIEGPGVRDAYDYTTPKETANAITDLDTWAAGEGNHYLNKVLNPSGAKGRNYRKVHFDPAQYEIVITREDGSEERQSPEMMNAKFGLNKLKGVEQRGRERELTIKQDRAYKQKKQEIESDTLKLKKDKLERENSPEVLEHENKMKALELKTAEAKLKTEQRKSSGGGSKTTSQLKFEANLSIDEKIAQLDELQKDETNHNAIYETVKNDSALFRALFPKDSSVKAIKNASTALALTYRKKELRDMTAEALKTNSTGGLVNVAKNYFGQYGLNWDNDMAAMVTNSLKTKGEAITAADIKLTSGAAFNADEMEVRLNAFLSALRGKTGAVALKNLDTAIGAWEREAHSYLAPLSGAQRAYVKGSTASFFKGIQSQPSTTKTEQKGAKPPKQDSESVTSIKTTISGMKTREEKKTYLKNLAKVNPAVYAEFVQSAKGQ